MKRTRPAATSEVGSNPASTDMQEILRTLLNEQRHNFMEMVRSLGVPNSAVRQNISLPKFNSESAEADAVSWCSIVDLIFAETPIEGSSLISALSGALTGEASKWLTQNCFAGISWLQFKELFLQRFGNQETSAATVMSLLNSQPKHGESIAAYGNRLVNELQAKWKQKSTEEVAVSVALAHMARIDKRLQRLACTTEVTTRASLQQELRAYSYVEKSTMLMGPPIKITKFSTPIKCHFCGKEGHKLAECRMRKEQHKDGRRLSTTPTSYTREKKSIICFKCGVGGHVASMCSKIAGATVQEKRIDACQLVSPKGVLVHSGESFQFYFDSGAECSLIKETMANKFSGKRVNNLVILKGIGNATVNSNVQIVSVVNINDLLLEIPFHVVVDKFLKYDIVVGREVLAMGFGVNITPEKFSIFRLKNIELCSKQPVDVNFQNVGIELNASDRSKLLSVLQKYIEFFVSGIPRKRVVTGQLEIRLIDSSKTVQRRPYRMSEEEREVVRQRIEELMAANVIRPSCSPFASPILLVKKKNGTDRLCVDYRELNANTVSDKFPLPLIADQIARLRGAKYFSCLDMASGFHQIPIHIDSVERTAFVTPDGQFEFLTMPFGLKNAPSVFQRAIIKALGSLVYSYVIVYMDDVMVVAATKEEALERLNIVLDTLTKAGFSFNLEKCSFMQTKVEYLGYEIQSGEIRPNPKKIKALTALPPPQTITQLRQFIGLASYFRQFIANFSKIMKPLYKLTSCKTLVWTPECEAIRQKIISILTEHPVLVIFDPQYELELHTDASSEGYGAILMHKIENKHHPIEYYSKTTSTSERNYHSYELETLAVVNSVKHFRHYLQGRQFTVFTDCNSVKSSLTKKELTPRAQRWWAYLQNFNFIVVYREGRKMAHVDFLSRNPISDKTFLKIEQKQINLAEITNDWLCAEQERDPEISSLVAKLRNHELGEDASKTYDLRNGILYRKIQRNGKTKCLPIVPRAFRWSVVNHVHDSIMHLGWEKTLDKIYHYYWFDKMSKYVRKFVENCMTCKLSKATSGKKQMELHPIPKTNIPWHTVHIDLTGKLSGKSDVKEYIIVQIDSFTKFVFLHHTVNIDSDSCINSVKSSIALLGLPTRIIADQGRCFASKNFRTFCSSHNIKLHLIATGASRANGQVERVMSTLKNLLTVVEASNRSWQDALGEIQLALNCTTNRTTKVSPLEMLIGKEARPFGLLATNENESRENLLDCRNTVLKRIDALAHYDKLRFDKCKANVTNYKVGDFVLLKNEERHQTKLDPKFRGPFKIIKLLDGDRYEIKSLNCNRTYKYAHEFLRKLPECIPNDEDLLHGDGVEKEYVVEKNIDIDFVNEIDKEIEKEDLEENNGENIDDEIDNGEIINGDI